MKSVRFPLFVLGCVFLAASAFAKTDAMSLIPAEAVSVGVVHFAELRSSPLSSMLFQQTDKMSANGDADRFLTDAGLDPAKDIDVLVVTTTPVSNMGTEARVLVAAEGRFNVDRLTRALVSRGAIRTTAPAGAYYLVRNEGHDGDHEQMAVAFPDSRLTLIGSEAAVLDALASRATGGTTFNSASGLGREAARIDPKATAWAIVDVARAARLTKTPMSTAKDQAQLATALKSVSTVALWATDAGDSVRLGAFGISRDAETLGLLEDTIRGALSAMRLAVQDKSADLVSVLRRFSVARNTDSVTVTGTIPAADLRAFAKQQEKVNTR